MIYNLSLPTYLKVVFLITANRLSVNALSLLEVLSTKNFLLNVGSQVVGYGFSSVMNHPYKISAFLPPIFTHLKYVPGFINEDPETKLERVAQLAALFTVTGSLTKNFNAGCNISIGTAIFVIADYIEKVANSSGNVPFVICMPHKNINKFSFKNYIKYNFMIVGMILILTSAGCFIVFLVRKIITFTKKNK